MWALLNPDYAHVFEGCCKAHSQAYNIFCLKRQIYSRRHWSISNSSASMFIIQYSKVYSTCDYNSVLMVCNILPEMSDVCICLCVWECVCLWIIWFPCGCEFHPLCDSYALTILLGNTKQHTAHILLIPFNVSPVDLCFYMQAESYQRV